MYELMEISENNK